MSVVTGKAHCRYQMGNQCTLCANTLDNQFPHLVWEPGTLSGSYLRICWRCAKKIKRGLVADLIQLVAIVDMHAAGEPSQVTLERRYKANNE